MVGAHGSSGRGACDNFGQGGDEVGGVVGRWGASSALGVVRLGVAVVLAECDSAGVPVAAADWAPAVVVQEVRPGALVVQEVVGEAVVEVAAAGEDGVEGVELLEADAAGPLRGGRCWRDAG